MKRTHRAALAVAVVLLALMAAGCASAGGTAASKRASDGPADALATAQTPFVGYKWLVTSIVKDGKRTPIPSRDHVYLLFTPNGQFGANDSINFHQATYRLVGDGFTTNNVIVGLAGYAGGSGVTALAIDAISAFTDEVHANAAVTGDRLIVLVGGFTLDCQRDGGSGRSIF
jgi:hypothetical protein